MAKFIGTDLCDDNWGEDFFIRKLMEYFNDSYIVYRNRPLFGTQFDVCMLIPTIGIVVFEVKAWRPETVLRVENGDKIIIKSNKSDRGEEKENPTVQARGYMFSMCSKIRQKLGKMPLVFYMVCFPQISKEFFDQMGMETVCELETTILKEDLSSKAALYKKINMAMKNCLRRVTYKSKFDDELMFRIRQIFESNLNKQDMLCEETDSLKGEEFPKKTMYSLFVYLPNKYEKKSDILQKIRGCYIHGVKLYIVVEKLSDMQAIAAIIDKVLSEKGLVRENDGLKIDFEGKGKELPNLKSPEKSFSVFHCMVCLKCDNNDYPYFEVADGKVNTAEIDSFLKSLGRNSTFNYEQYQIEHADNMKNVLVKAGAGTGKTYTMISRISYICHVQKCSIREMINRIVMITFTNDAADHMKDKIKEYFDNCYLLTGERDYLEFINHIDDMQISTIHSYTKKIICMLGMELGYGINLSVASGEYYRKKIVSDFLDEYLGRKQKLYGVEYVSKLGMPIYAVKDTIIEFINQLNNQSIDVEMLKADNFGSVSGYGSKELHELLTTIIPEVETLYHQQLKKENKLHLNTMMATFENCLNKEENIERLIAMQSGRPQYMFIDEFQDTDDTQIRALKKIAELLQYKLFVVGDIKQCIYRFRGAKEKAFDQLQYEKNPAEWKVYSLNRNYRTDEKLLDIFDKSFSIWGSGMGEEALLVYQTEKDTMGNEKGDKLLGVQRFNDGCSEGVYYKKISIDKESERIAALFNEINRQKERIESDLRQGVKLPKSGNEIAVLVRENWQADIIRKEGRKRGLEIITNTGGDLYYSEPALDMLKLANALLHYDESDYLYAFVASNFISSEPSKARLLQIRQNEKSSWKKQKVEDTTQAEELQKLINAQLSASVLDSVGWNRLISGIRTRPILQVLRNIYSILKPWANYAKGDKQAEIYYRQNVELLFEELVSTSNAEALSINALVDILNINIMSRKNVDSRVPDNKKSEVIIRCITAHKAKGLEYGAVILPYCSMPINRMKNDGLNISVNWNNGKIEIGYQLKIKDNGSKLQNSYFNETDECNERMREETRILYVAMTRAIRSFSWISLNRVKKECWQKLIWDGSRNHGV